MKKTLFLMVFLSVLLVSQSASGFISPDLEENYHFSYPSIEKSGNYDIISIENTKTLSNPGSPLLPEKSIQIPITKDINHVEITFSSQELTGPFNIYPSQMPRTFNMPNNETLPNDDYSKEFYPETPYKILDTIKINGKNYINIKLYPVQHTSEKNLIFHEDFTVKIFYSFPRFMSSSSPSPASSSYACPGIENWTETELDYIIITNNSLKDKFQVLANWKTKKGVPAKVIRISEEITNSSDLNCSGTDTQEKIKNLINDTFRIYNISYVLLGGDTNVVPHRGGWIYLYNSPTYTDNVTTDVYYADLDNNWDANSDGFYGNGTQDSINYYYDVYIGRAPVDTETEAETFVNKSINYEKNPQVNISDVLLLGAQLDSNPTWGGDAMEALENYFPSSSNISKRYEKHSNITVSTTSDSMNLGPHIVVHAAHGSTTYFDVNGNFGTAQAGALTNNPKNFLFASIACHINRFDSASVSESMMNNQNGGSFAFIGNTREGWYYQGSADSGGSINYIKQIFNYTYNSSYYSIGKIVAKAKETFVPDMLEWNPLDDNYERWMYYEINLLGDPELPIYKTVPQNLLVPVSSYVNSGDTLTINIQNSTSNIPNATVTLQAPGYYSHNTTDSNGNVSFSISGISNSSLLNITVTKQNYIPNETNTTVIDTVGPGSYIYGVNSSIIHRGDAWLAYARWNELNSSFITFNATSALHNYTVQTNSNNWTNHTNLTNNTWTLGSHLIQFWANDTNGNWNHTNITLQMRGWAEINASSMGGSINESQYSVLKCQVNDKNLTQEIENYTVNFYDNSSLLGSNLTNSSGWAILNHSFTNPGIFNISCNVSDNSTLFYSTLNRTNYSTIEVNDTAAPLFSSLSPGNASYLYTNNATYYFYFNITWIDTGQISNVAFEFNGTNYSFIDGNVTNTSAVFSTNRSNLAVGNYTYRWYANDTEGFANSTNNYTFNITKSSPLITIYINGSSSNNSAVSARDIINLTASINTTEKNVTLYSNFTGTEAEISSGTNNTSNITNTSSLTESAVYNLTAYSASSENYTAAITTLFFGICPICSDNTSWSSCTNSQQTRTIYYCNVSSNYACSSYSESRSCTSSTSSSGGGGGGGGASSSTTTYYSETLTNIEPEQEAEIKIDKSGIAISNIEIDVKEEINAAEIIVRSLSSKPSGTSEPDKDVYQYLSIVLTIEDEKIDSSNIEFSVPKTWYFDNGLDYTTTKLIRYSNGWEELPTKYKSHDSSNYFFEAETPGFSSFAIIADKITLPKPTQTKETEKDEIEIEKNYTAEIHSTEKGLSDWIKYFAVALLFVIGFILYKKLHKNEF